jgi:hypothetical protein
MNADKAKKAHVWERDELDWYVEPTRATEALLSVERFVGVIWDPCCGQGNIVSTLVAAGYEAFGTDIVQRVDAPPAWWRGAMRYQNSSWAVVGSIVSNPPFFGAKGTEEFIRWAIDQPVMKVAVFADIRFIAGHKRAKGLFRDVGLPRVWIVTPRVSCPPGSYLAAVNKAGGGSSDWCWLVWDRTAATMTPTWGHCSAGPSRTAAS